MIGSVGIFGLTLLLASVSIGGLSIDRSRPQINDDAVYQVSQWDSDVFEDVQVTALSNLDGYDFITDMGSGTGVVFKLEFDGTNSTTAYLDYDYDYTIDDLYSYLPSSTDALFGYFGWTTWSGSGLNLRYHSCVLPYMNVKYLNTNLGQLLLDGVEFDVYASSDFSTAQVVSVTFKNFLTNSLVYTLSPTEQDRDYYGYAFDSLVKSGGDSISNISYFPYYIDWATSDILGFVGDLYIQSRLCFNYRGVGGFNAGYNLGYTDGYDNGLTDGESTGYNNGYQNGYNEGYANGMNVGESASFLGLFGAIADTPVMMLQALFSFDLFGTSMLVIIMSLLTGIIVLYLIKKVWK